jgi:tRNA nucleotidyltransferase (CCA-adding enzyme)
MKSPNYVKQSMAALVAAGFEAYIVGGCVRDLLMKKEPKDWDITTNALPEEIQKIFPESVYENNFGTVGVKIKKGEETIDILEITTYRIESNYTDKRHPDKVEFTNKIEQDLGRRDFTVNSMAMDLNNLKKRTKIELIDPFNGQKDLVNKTIKAVGDPSKRFNEDALRMIRAIRFAVTLNFKIEDKTIKSIQKHSKLIRKVANERIKDEFIKIISSNHPDEGILLIRKTSLLGYILPELEKGVGVNQNKHHTYTIFKHLILALKYCPSSDYRVRLASLFHDIAKPQTKRGNGENATFYNHDLVGAKVTTRIMKRLAFSNEDIEIVSHLVKNHMFYYNVDEVSEAGVRRLLKKVGKNHMKDLMDVRIADRLGSGVPKAKPYKLRHLEYLIDKVDKDPISVKNLKISGETLIRELKMPPGPKFGAILECLLAEVIEDPAKNSKIYLKTQAKKLYKMELNKLRKQARGKIEERKEEEDKEIKKKHWVK